MYKINELLTPSKLEVGQHVIISVADLSELAMRIFQKASCDDNVAVMVAEHLVETNLR